MEFSKSASQLPIFPLFIAVSLVIGWLIPGFYTWTDSDQSRPSPLLWKVPLWSAMTSAAFCLALPWLPVTTKLSIHRSPSTMHFSLRMLLAITSAIGIAMALLTAFPLVTSSIICAAAYAYSLAIFVARPPYRIASAALLACMLLPYMWVVGYKELDRILPTFAVMILGMPAFIPAALISRWVGQDMDHATWQMFLLTALELAIGIWMIRLGPKRTIAYLLIVMHISALGSLVFHMLCLA